MIPPIHLIIEAQRLHEQDMQFEKSLASLPPDVAHSLRQKRAEEKEKARKEAQEERRHKELCAAIRSTGFWRF